MSDPIAVVVQPHTPIAVTVSPLARAHVVVTKPPIVYPGAVVVERLSITALARGPAGADGYRGATHLQPQPSATWTIDHNLGRYPTAVRTRDSEGRDVEGVPSYPTVDRVVVEFSAAISGTAYLI